MPALVLGLLAAAPTVAPAADVPAGHSVSTFAAWWARPGSPGWTPDASLSFGIPPVFAGLSAGGFELRDPLAPAALPAPGVAEAQAPLAWYDSATVVVGEGAAWRGFGTAIASATPVLAPPTSRKPRSVWTVVSGDAGLDRNGIYVSRGDERSWVRGGAVADQREVAGDLERAGDHLWLVNGGARRGRHVLDGSFAQRGSAERQRVGAADAAKGESGSFGWSWSDSIRALSARLSRGRDARESFAAGDVIYPWVRREAQSNVAELAGSLRRGRGELGARIEVRQGRVSREYAGSATRDTWEEHAVWAAARVIAPVGSGRLELELGGGRHDAPSRRRERWQMSPALVWRAGGAARSLRVFAERVVDPVWSDLSAGVRPFVQDSWVSGAEVRAARRNAHAGALALTGSTGGRAVLVRFPVRDVALLQGWEAEDERYRFAFASAEAGVSWRVLSLEGSGYLLAREGDRLARRVDPAVGATAAVGAAFRLFTGDLGVRLRAEASWIGERETDTRDALFGDVTLPGYATLAARGEFTLGDATFVLRADGLENVRHEETWLDLASAPDLRLARDSGRTFRFEMIWPLFN
ncbi:MAG: hypothetical protein IT347_10875 [Candidatus Eisenbacteria bacterium]|nr:hypothetical protein [Candidatus Eisenbacteria bacterium]